MLVVHPASLCDVCLDPYIISTEPANSPHVIACGHIFCLACLRNLSPSACPLCRKLFESDRVKKLHVAGPPELGDTAEEEAIEAEATQLLQRVALVSGENVPDVQIIEVVTLVEEWLSNKSTDGNSHRPLRTSLAALRRYKALQERNERDQAEFCRVRRELKTYRRNAHQDSKTSRVVEESLLSRIDEIERFARLTHLFQLSRLYAEIDSLQSDPQQPPYPSHNASNPLPPPPEPLPLDRFPAFARPGGAADIPDPLLSAVPYPPPPPRTQPTTSATITNGYPPVTAYAGTSHTKYAPRTDERNKRPATQEANGINHPREERRPHAESSRTGAGEVRFASTDRRSQIDASPRRGVVAPSPAPSWAHHPLVEGARSDEEREVRSRTHTNGTNGIINGSCEVDPRPTVTTRLASAEAYLQGYGSGYGSGFQIVNEPSPFAPSSYGSDRSDRVHGFPVQESPEQPIGGLGLMGVPQPIAGTVSTPDEAATPVSRAVRLIRRNATQAVDVERPTRRLGDQSLLQMPQNGGARRAPVQSIDQVLGVRRTVTDSALRQVVNGVGDPARHRRTVSGVAAPLAREDESPRSETTWGTVPTPSGDSINGASMSSLGLLVGLHNGGVRAQGSVADESYVGREGLGDSVTSEGAEEDETETPIITGSLPGSESDVPGLGLIMEDEGEQHSGSRIGRVLENMTPHRRTTSNTERNPQTLGTSQDHQPRRARRSEGTNDQRRHASQSSIAEALRPADSGRAVNASNITSTNALSLHFDASFPTHGYQDHALSAASGLEIVAPTPIVGGPNIIHLWANRA
ncbi:hypothetical protein HD554DRAFT_2026090 [Boletus coccyginus]|nr:hypothetical protein HD554DRAFT_2026090 [Boletus coccyginus]